MIQKKQYKILLLGIVTMLPVWAVAGANQVINDLVKDDQKIQVAVDARETKKVPVILFCITEGSQEQHPLKDVLATVEHDLEFTQLFAPATVYVSALPSKKQLKAEYGSLATAVSITESADGKYFAVRLYNVAKGSVINRKEYKIHKKSSVRRGWGHAIADVIVEVLAGSKGCFSSKLAYCKQLSENSWGICVTDYDGQHETLVAKAGLLMGSRWHCDQESPAVLFSKYTTSNIRLIRVDITTGEQNTAVSFEGLNMLPAFAPDESELVVCLSCSGSSQIYSYTYDSYANRMKYKQLTFNDGNNIAPTLLENNDIVFCSDFEDNRPYLYRLIRSTGEIVKLLSGKELCFSPVYSVEIKKLLFSKIVSGVGQIFMYDFATDQETQLTFDGAHKQEPCWSPCGTYFAFEVQETKNKRIAIQNIGTGKRTYVTPAGAVCSYPTWSANFPTFPHVKSLK